MNIKTLVASIIISTSLSVNALASNQSSIPQNGYKDIQVQGYKPPIKVFNTVPVEKPDTVNKIDRSKLSTNLSEDILDDIIPKLNKISNISDEITTIESFGDKSSLIMLKDIEGNVIFFDRDVKDFIIGNIQFTNVGDYLVSVNSIRNIMKNKEPLDRLLETNKEHFAKFSAHSDSENLETAYVFADYGCPYCKRLLQNVDLINKLGINVYFVPFLNAGLSDRKSVDITRKILCSNDKQAETIKAFDNPASYFNNIKKDELNCPASFNVLKILKISDSFDVKATPTTIISNGFLFEGYNDIQSYVKDFAFGVVDGNAIKNIE